MKRCPQCGRTYPDSEAYCGDDGSALPSDAADGRATTMMEPDEGAAAMPLECPVCGGKAQPGEVICNFCGSHLGPDPVTVGGATATAAAAAPSRSAATLRSPEAFVPGRDRVQASDGMPDDDDPGGGRNWWSLLGFLVAALVALGAGAWLAVYLSGRHTPPPVASASPLTSPSPAAVSSPAAVLATNIPIQVTGNFAGSPERDPKALGKNFDDNQSTLNDVYRNALAANPSLSDGMMLRLHITPDGTVSSGAVRTSTASNPSLDAEVVKAANGWKFPPASGTGVEADYPIIFRTSPSDAATIEANLQTKLASLGPNQSPEYALTVGPGGSPAVAASPAASPELAAVPPAPAVVATPPPIAAETPAPHHRRRLASAPRPTPSINERLHDELSASKKFKRVHAYASGGNVTLAGKVFDDADKRLAENTARGVRGVTSVTNNLTTDEQDWAMNASRIAQQLQAAGLTGVTVKVIGKAAYLNGTVATDADRERAVSIAQSAAPVVVRVNLINVEPGRVFGF